jgi:hypothetical protein
MGLLRGLGRAALYGSATCAGFAGTLKITQPAKFDAASARLTKWRADAEGLAHTLRHADPQQEAAAAAAFVSDEVQTAARWQSMLFGDMVTSSLAATQEGLAEQAAQAQALVEEQLEELIPAESLLRRVEVQVILPGGRNYSGTALKGPLTLSTECVPDGYGKMLFASGDSYAGGFRDGAMHGRGRWESATGEEYVGEFTNGEREGEGSLIDAAGRVVHQGRWSGGEFVGA